MEVKEDPPPLQWLMCSCTEETLALSPPQTQRDGAEKKHCFYWRVILGVGGGEEQVTVSIQPAVQPLPVGVSLVIT